MNEVRSGELDARSSNALARWSPLLMGIIEKETKQTERERYEVWVAAEAERLAAYKELAPGLTERASGILKGASMSTQKALELHAETAVDAHLVTRDASASTHTEVASAAGTAGGGCATRVTQPAAASPKRYESKNVTSSSTRAELESEASTAGDTSTPASQDQACWGPRGCATRVTQPAATSPKRYESKDVFIGQTYPVDMARMKLDAQNEALKKEIAYALAPPGTPPAPAPVRDPDYEPSPIPGLQNRHLNYLKFAGMPLPELKRRGFVSPRGR
jgi:hypothetical protein